MSGNALTILGPRWVLVLAVSADILLSSSSDRCRASCAEVSHLSGIDFCRELTTFAETGELSTSLRLNFALARQNPKVVRFF